MSYTLIYGTGFGMDDLPLATISGDVTIEDTEVKTAPHSAKCVSSGSYVYAQWQPCENRRSYVIGVHVYAAAGTEIYFTRDDVVGYNYSLRYNEVDEAWDLYLADDLIQEGTKKAAAGEWCLVEIVAYLGTDPFSGHSFNHVEINTRINLVTDLYYAAEEDRDPALIQSSGYFRIGVTDSATMYFDNLTLGYNPTLTVGNRITSSYFPGDIRYTPLDISAEDTIEWTPSTGADNAALIDEQPFSETDYNSTGTDEHQDLFTVEDLDSTLRDIQFLGAWFQVWSDNTDDMIKALVESDGVQQTVSLGAPGVTEVYKFASFATDPGNDAVWTNTSVNAATVGYEADITTGNVYVGAMLIEIGWTPKVLSTYSRAGGFDVRMTIPVITDTKWVGLLTDVAMVEDANITGSAVVFERNGNNLYIELLEYPGYAITKKITSGVDGTKAHDVRVIFHDNFISVYIDESWIVTFSANLADYDTENTISLISDPTYGGSATITNIVKSELYVWREGIYIEMETSGMSAIQSAIQERPLIITADSDGKIVFTYDISRDSFNTGSPRVVKQIVQESPQAASDALVYADEVFAIPNAQYGADVGWQTRVFRLFTLGGDARFAAQMINRAAIERQTMYDLTLRPDLRAQITDEMTFSENVVSHSGESVGDTIIIESISGQMQDGAASQSVTGRKKVF